MKNALIKLLKVKSIITIILAVVFCVLTIMGLVSEEQFCTVFTTVIAFYFGIQTRKDE